MPGQYGLLPAVVAILVFLAIMVGLFRLRACRTGGAILGAVTALILLILTWPDVDGDNPWLRLVVLATGGL